jgi:hypothetical protein
MESGNIYSANSTVDRDMVVVKKKFTQPITTKEEFYQAFGLQMNSDGIYQTSQTVMGSFVLMSHIDFGGDCINIKGFSGVLEGNGYSLRNIKSKFGIWGFI